MRLSPGKSCNAFVMYLCEMSNLQHFKTLLGLVYLLPGAGETFSFTPNVTGAGCHGG